MIVLDTCVLIFDALFPKKLSATAKKALTHGEKNNLLFCSDISLWETAMLIKKSRLTPGTDAATFLRLVLDARRIQVLPISIEIAVLSTTLAMTHADPADRVIAASAILHQADLVTCDAKLKNIANLSVIW